MPFNFKTYVTCLSPTYLSGKLTWLVLARKFGVLGTGFLLHCKESNLGPFFLFFYFLSRDQFFVIVTKIWSRWQKIGRDDNWNCRVTNFLSSWQKFGNDDNWNCWYCLYFDQTPIIIKYAWTLIKSQSTKSRMFGHGSNCSNHHQGCLYCMCLRNKSLQNK